jgi:hypothetical protein
VSRCEEFRALHRPGVPLLLPNAWDEASASSQARSRSSRQILHGPELLGSTSRTVDPTDPWPTTTSSAS